VRCGKSFIIAAAAAACVATVTVVTVVTAGTANAIKLPQQQLYTFSTLFTNSQVAGNGGNWAVARLSRHTVLTGGREPLAGDCGQTSGFCLQWTVTVSDSGTFTTKPGAPTPNQSDPGLTIHGTNDGTFTATTQSATFYTNQYPDPAQVPSQYNGTIPAWGWAPYLFPAGTHIIRADGMVSTTAMTATYTADTRCGDQTWVDTFGNDAGNLPVDGNITGCYLSVG
jgi:hypothetical protein